MYQLSKHNVFNLWKLETDNELLSAKILLIEKELFSRENDLSSDERTISTLREKIEFLKENIGGLENSERKAAEDNSSLSAKILTDEEWESIKGLDFSTHEVIMTNYLSAKTG